MQKKRKWPKSVPQNTGRQAEADGNDREREKS
jgi:hypothetical protein